MIRTILLATAMTISAPLLAQTAAPAAQTTKDNPATDGMPATTVDQQATTGQTAPESPLPASGTPATTAQTTPSQAAPTQTPPAQTQPSQSAQTGSTAAPAPTTPTQPQVAQLVDQQFGTYDKDANGSLSKAEFAAWMTALKTQSNTKAADPAADTAWNDAAFKQADGDKSSTVSKTELTSFLVKGSSGKS